MANLCLPKHDHARAKQLMYDAQVKLERGVPLAHLPSIDPRAVSISGYSSGLTLYAAKQSYAEGILMVSGGAASTDAARRDVAAVVDRQPDVRLRRTRHEWPREAAASALRCRLEDLAVLATCRSVLRER